MLRPSLFAIRALKGVTAIGVEAELLRDIWREFRHEEKEELVVKAVEELRKGHSKLVRVAEWSERDGLLHFRGKIYIPGSPELRCWIVSQHHDTRVAGHAGWWKTLELVACNYWWPQMSCYIGQYVKTCDLCLWTKAQCQPLIGELAPLPVPEFHWDTISVNFIVELLDSHGYDAVMNVVDSVSKMSHFIPMHTTVTALRAAHLFLTHVWKLHGLPRQVVSDQGPHFIAEFMWELYWLLGVKLAATTTYHPQGDGQTE